MRFMKGASALVVLLSAVTPAPAAPEYGGQVSPGDRPPLRVMVRASVERAAMHNILAELLSQRTGRAASEILELLEHSPPPEVARQLGIGDEELRPLFESARQELIRRALDAQLITPEQVERLRSAPRPEPPAGRGPFRDGRSVDPDTSAFDDRHVTAGQLLAIRQIHERYRPQLAAFDEQIMAAGQILRSLDTRSVTYPAQSVALANAMGQLLAQREWLLAGLRLRTESVLTPAQREQLAPDDGGASG